MRLIITGGTGFLAQELEKKFSSEHEIFLVTRKKISKENQKKNFICWDEISSTINENTAIIHLAGDNIGEGRWTEEKKRKILSSRVETGKTIISEIKKSKLKPKLLIQASGVAYYGRSEEKIFSESDPPANGKDFLSNVCIEWENSTKESEAIGIRRVVMRIGLVLGRDGALRKLALPFRFFAGGELGSGRQPVSWIHIEDFTSAVKFFLENENSRGAYNLTSPEPVTNSVFAKTLGKILHHPSFLRVPAIAIKILLGETADYLALQGQSVIPKRLQEENFSFQYPTLESALAEIYRIK